MLPHTKFPISSEYIGATAYERSYSIKFIHEQEIDSVEGPTERIRILPSPERLGFPHLAGKSIALVGNGNVTGCGALIDSHDVVIRMTTMRQWKKSARDDGERLTIWTGQPVFAFQDTPDDPAPLPSFEEALKNGVECWANSPFHISLGAFKWLKAHGMWERMLVAPPPFHIYEAMCSTYDAEDLRLLFSPIRQTRFLVGFTAYELLLTGTRVALLLELLDVSRLSLFGFDLFASSPDQLWFGHSIDVDWKTLQIIKRRFQSRGRQFYWHEEDIASKLSAGLMP